MVPPRPCTPPEIDALRALSGGAVRDARRMPDGRYLHTNEHGLVYSTDRRLVDEYLVAMRPAKDETDGTGA